MIAGGWVLLLKGGFVFLVDDDKSEILKRKKDCTSSPKNNIVGMG